ncbi:hypothetical protein C3B44_11245 [Corynebacterium yudongzhengii]|uniref:DUF2029 domain-containing protein n=1 Tax=Corynebacterium yudongzhengii TaxID=2080740 RepID=A0A2U1T4G5_9CORY|nr:glycosyltransferase 87 family protein [Corynebacterium yudongzhengii]AWB82834.1 hypothetical protein C3B44_11245 [Corynebacterium yudongzhengii]PWC00872.1 DUF2029 domain-containing protein [Corynebacterium yudongzhengii]
MTPSASKQVSPAATEPIARPVAEFLGGPTGVYGVYARGAFWTPLRVIIALASVFLALGFLQKAPCLRSGITENGAVGLNWDGNRQYAAACYNDILPLYEGRGLDQPGFVYAFSWTEGGLTRYMEYPVLAGYFQGLMGWVARTTYPLIDAVGLTLAEASWYFILTAAVMGALWMVTIRMVAELAGNRMWDVVLVAASPLVIVHAFTNWDIPSISFVVGALYAAARHRPVLAGVLIGLGTAFKLWPLYLLGAFVVLAARRERWLPVLKMLLGAAASWLVVNLPVMIAYPQAWGEFLRLNSERGWEWTTIWAVIGRMTGWEGFDAGEGEPVILNTVTFVLFVFACLAIAIFGLKVRRTPRVAELFTLIVIAFLLVNKVWSPQYSLWLLIPAVLAVPNWRLIFTWATVDMLVWPILMWHMMGVDDNGAPAWLLNAVILARDGLIIAIAIQVIRQMRGEVVDRVLSAHEGVDPLAGPFGDNEKPVASATKEESR